MPKAETFSLDRNVSIQTKPWHEKKQDGVLKLKQTLSLIFVQNLPYLLVQISKICHSLRKY
jgi:hypothetical protein